MLQRTSRSSTTLFWVSCAVLFHSGLCFTFQPSVRFGHPRRTGVATWAKRLTLGPALEALGLRRGATLEEAKAAYRARVREVHPDRDPSPEAAAQYQLFTESYEFVTLQLGPGGSGSGSNLGATIDFAASMFGFAQSVMSEVAMPLAGAVAEVAVDAATPAWRNAAATANGVRSGRSWAQAKIDADVADSERRLATAEAKFAAAVEALSTFETSEWAQPHLEAALATKARVEADAEKAESDVSNARARMAAAQELEAEVFRELAMVRDSLDAVASCLPFTNEKVASDDSGIGGGAAAAAVAAGKQSPNPFASLSTMLAENSFVSGGAEQLERELVDLTATAAALGVRVKFWAWKAAAGFLPDSDRSSVEPVLAALRAVARDLDEAAARCEQCTLDRAQAKRNEVQALQSFTALAIRQGGARAAVEAKQAEVEEQAPKREALLAEVALRETQQAALEVALAELQVKAEKAAADAAAAAAESSTREAAAATVLVKELKTEAESEAAMQEKESRVTAEDGTAVAEAATAAENTFGVPTAAMDSIVESADDTASKAAATAAVLENGTAWAAAAASAAAAMAENATVKAASTTEPTVVASTSAGAAEDSTAASENIAESDADTMPVDGAADEEPTAAVENTTAAIENTPVMLGDTNAAEDAAVEAEDTAVTIEKSTVVAEDDTAATNESTVNNAIRAVPSSTSRKKQKVRGQSRGFGKTRN